MVTYSNNAEQLAAWHHLYLPNAAEHFTQTRSCDLWQPLFFVNSMCGLVGIKQTVRGSFDGTQSMCYLCFFSVTALVLGRETQAAVWLNT